MLRLLALKLVISNLLGLVLLTCCLASAQVPARSSRIAFRDAMRRIPQDATEATVKNLLGPPDDIWPPNDSRNFVGFGDTGWCYGTNGHHTFPTLGYVVFRNGKVNYAIGGSYDPPTMTVIGETELEDGLRQLAGDVFGTNYPGWKNPGPAKLIQAANWLISKGKAKAVAILAEYSRLCPSQQDTWLFWLARVAFISNRPRGVFSVPYIGSISPPLPGELANWPTYPVFLVDDIPFCFLDGVSLGGLPQSFAGYLQKNEADWSLRSKPLSPTNDPFAAYSDVLESAEWPYSKGGSNAALGQVLQLVQTGYRPVLDASSRRHLDSYGVNAKDFDRYHKEFLALRCHWDPSKQIYVRGDGSVLKESHLNNLQHGYTYRHVPDIQLTVVLWRSDPEGVVFETNVKKTGTRMQPAVIDFQDAASGKQIAFCAVNADAPLNSLKDQILALPTHERLVTGRTTVSGFALPTGRCVRCILYYNGKQYDSSVIVP